MFQNYLEVNNTAFGTSDINEDFDVKDLLRLGHLNQEEGRLLLKVCRKYSGAIYREGQELTFSNKIRHGIPTTNDVPVYTKS